MITSIYQGILATIQRAITGSEQIDNQSLIVLWGSRGSGKTSVLQFLASTLPDREQGIIVVGPLDADRHTADAYAGTVSEAVSAVSRGAAKIVVLLDNLDVLAHTPGRAALYAFEQAVLVQLVQEENVTIIATARAPITWRDWETRSRNQVLHIPYFGRDEVGELAVNHRINPDDAFRLTLGHPQMLNWLYETPNISESEIALRAAAYFLDGLPVPIAESATWMSLLPSFDVAVLREVMSDAARDVAAGFYSQYLDRIHDLIAAGLLFWSADTGGYRFLDGVVRYHLARSYRFRRADDACRIHQLAARYYQSEATRVGVLQAFIVNVIYHLTYAAGVIGAERPGKPGIDWIQQQLSGWAEARWPQVNDAWHTGAGDWVVKQELDDLIGPEDSSHITALLESGNVAAPTLSDPMLLMPEQESTQ